MWQIIISILRLVSSYTYAFIAAVHSHPDMNQWLMYKLPILFESMFGLEIILKFITAIRSDCEHDHGYIYDFVRISHFYWNTTFFWDFIPLLPLHLMDLSYGRQQYFLWIKVVRLVACIARLDVREIHLMMKSW